VKVRYVFKLLAKHKVKLIQYTLLLSLILSSLLPWTGIYDLNPKPIMVIKTNSLGIIEALELIQNEAPTNYPIALTSIMLYTISIVTTTLYSIKPKKRKTGYISGILAITSSIPMVQKHITLRRRSSYRLCSRTRTWTTLNPIPAHNARHSSNFNSSHRHNADSHHQNIQTNNIIVNSISSNADRN